MRFTDRAVQCDIYCAFIAAHAPGQLKYHLEDAAARGEIPLVNALPSEQIWPSNVEHCPQS